MTDYTARRIILKNAGGEYLIPYTDKQDQLVSGTNIKTLNNVSLLGSGNISVQASITGGASTITSSNLTASRALVSNSNGKVAVSSVTSAELGYLSGVTSAIQTQINGKVSSASPALTGTPTAPTAASTVNNTQIATTAYVVAHRCTTAATTTSSASIYKPAIVVENYKNGTEWYRKWSDGWIEQGGYITQIPAGTGGSSVTFSKAFTDTNYFSVPSWGTAEYAALSLIATNRTTTGMKIANRTNVPQYCYWYACGY